jgi:Concanavalin A-like lectin/glucanases superfamily/Immunoglobulin domain
MKSMKQMNKAGSIIRGMALGLAVLSCATMAKGATSLYFDVNGTTAGYGIVNGSTYSWDAANWDTTTGGGASVSWGAGDFARFYGGASGYTYTVTANNSESMAGLFENTAGVTVIINAAGSGNLSIVSGQQGFFINGSSSASSSVIINAPIIGPGGIQNNDTTGFPGSLDLYGNNSYAGGTTLVTSGGVNFNNNNSFGTGPITWGAAQMVLASTNTTPLTLPNAMGTVGGDQLIFVSSAPITFSGNWTNGAGTSRLTMNTAATKMIIGGHIYGSSGNILKDGPGTLVINSTDTNNNVTSTVTNGTLEVGASGQLAGSIVVSNAGSALPVLQLDTVTSLNPNANLFLVSSLASGSVNLNFSGTNTIYALFIDGVSQPAGTYGSSSSTAANQNGIFAGSGVLSVAGPPEILQQPESLAVFEGTSSLTFSVNSGGSSPFTYQWKTNGVAIPGATDSSLTISPVMLSDAGTYSVAITNAYGFTNGTIATLNVLTTNAYTQTVIGDGPISYWRLDETSGTTAFDDISSNNGTYVNVTLNQPGFSLTDTDPSIGLPATNSARGYVKIANYPAFNFIGKGSTFTLEAWAYFTNVSSIERVFSSLANSGNGYAFGINGSSGLIFTQNGVQDATVSLTNSLITGVWYQLVVTGDGSSYNFFLNGTQVGSVPVSGAGFPINEPLQFGANPPDYATAQQVLGRIDEVAIYANNLDAQQVYNHYIARYGNETVPIVSKPVATPPTNYVSLTTTIQAVAGGGDLAYQWYMSPSTPLTDETNATLTLTNLQMSDEGSYYVQVTNALGSSNSPTVAITVLPIPTNAAQLNLTNGLVLHLPFDGSYADVSGRGNNGTNVGATSFVSPGAIGTNALHYFSDPTVPTYNYVTLGICPDLQFSSNIDFSVAFWVRETNGSSMTNLPFFGDMIGSTSTTNTGFAFAPYETATTSGGWQWALNTPGWTAVSPNAFTSFPDANVLNDGNWHSLIFVAQRSANLTTYLDGQQVDTEAINYLVSLNTNNAAVIGQDPTGQYAVTGAADLDDLGVWKRTLTPLEVSGIYLAGASNSVSFAPPSAAIVPVALTIHWVSGQLQISWTGGGTLQSAPSVNGTYTDVPGATSPYTVPSGPVQMFYRLKY